MESTILRPNATPVYGFLSFIHKEIASNGLSSRKILDCGAGGPLPPLALFHQHGFETWGIDTSEEQLDKANQFVAGTGMELHLQIGDMRCIPFPDESFDAVYEHFSMCHLSKVDTAIAIHEMYRVLKPGGFCFIGFISTDCWPRSFFGGEREPGEYWGEEDGRQNVLHSMFTDEETSKLVSGWKIVKKEKQVQYLREAAEQTSFEEWMGLFREAGSECVPASSESWKEQYQQRVEKFRYVHTYYFLKKE